MSEFDHKHKRAMEIALLSMGDDALHIASELRHMANANPPYASFAHMPAHYKNIWLAAADLLEGDYQGAVSGEKI